MGKGKPLFEVLQAQKAEQGGKLDFTVPKGKAKPARQAEPQPEPQRAPELPDSQAEPLQEVGAVAESHPAPDEADRHPLTHKAPPPVERAEGPPADEAAEVGAGLDDHGPEAASVDEAEGGGIAARQAVRWLREPIGWQVPRGAAAAAAAVLVLAVGGSFFVGQRVGVQSAIAYQQEYEAATASLAELQAEPNRGLIPSTVPGVEGPGAAAGYAEGLGDGDDGDDPRIAGLNYFRLITVPATAGEEIFRIVDFLRDHEVDAAVVPINNGRSLKVVALPGFERPRSDPRALELQERLKMLGRKWRSEHRGSTDWRDLMAERYRPGVN